LPVDAAVLGLGFLGPSCDFGLPNANGFCGHRRKPPSEEALKKLWSQFA
jgi:hypothetical protein